MVHVILRTLFTTSTMLTCFEDCGFVQIFSLQYGLCGSLLENKGKNFSQGMSRLESDRLIVRSDNDVSMLTMDINRVTTAAKDFSLFMSAGDLGYEISSDGTLSPLRDMEKVDIVVIEGCEKVRGLKG